jgi:hypothetical protein
VALIGGNEHQIRNDDIPFRQHGIDGRPEHLTNALVYLEVVLDRRQQSLHERLVT